MAAFGADGGRGAEVVAAVGAEALFGAAAGAVPEEPEWAAGEGEEEQQVPQGDDHLETFGSGAFCDFSFVSVGEVADVDAEMLFTGSKTEVGELGGFGGVDLGMSLTERGFPAFCEFGFE